MNHFLEIELQFGFSYLQGIMASIRCYLPVLSLALLLIHHLIRSYADNERAAEFTQFLFM
jgi:hypothetical protein